MIIRFFVKQLSFRAQLPILPFVPQICEYLPRHINEGRFSGVITQFICNAKNFLKSDLLVDPYVHQLLSKLCENFDDCRGYSQLLELNCKLDINLCTQLIQLLIQRLQESINPQILPLLATLFRNYPQEVCTVLIQTKLHQQLMDIIVAVGYKQNQKLTLR